MPTENRSSSTELPQVEAAGAAMTQIRTMLGREQRPAQVAAALEACDWSDTPIGNKAIILSAIRALRTKQPHHEPIAWMVGTAFWWTKEEAERDAAETGMPVVPVGPMTAHQGDPVWFMTEGGVSALHAKAKAMSDQQGLDTSSYSVPLYTHADPGEVEQLSRIIRDLNDERDEIGAEAGRLRAQLAERDALLTRALPYLSNTPDLVQHGAEDLAEEIRNVSDGRPCYGPNEWGTECGKCSKCKPASAEPSAPVERDERAEFEACIRREWPMAPISRKRDLLPKDDPCFGDYCDEPLQRAWVGWQMRAALERKPS